MRFVRGRKSRASIVDDDEMISKIAQDFDRIESEKAAAEEQADLARVALTEDLKKREELEAKLRKLEKELHDKVGDLNYPSKAP